MVVRRTLTPFVGVRFSHPQPPQQQSCCGFFRGVAQLVARLVRDQAVGSESRHSDHKKLFFHRLEKELFVFSRSDGIRTARSRHSGAQTVQWTVCEGAGESAPVYRIELLDGAEANSPRKTLSAPTSKATHASFKDFPPPFYKKLPRAFSALGSEVFISPSISFHPDFIWVCLIQSFQSKPYIQALLPNHCQ